MNLAQLTRIAIFGAKWAGGGELNQEHDDFGDFHFVLIFLDLFLGVVVVAFDAEVLGLLCLYRT